MAARPNNSSPLIPVDLPSIDLAGPRWPTPLDIDPAVLAAPDPFASPAARRALAGVNFDWNRLAVASRPPAFPRLPSGWYDSLTFANLRGYWVELRAPAGKPHLFKPGRAS